MNPPIEPNPPPIGPATETPAYVKPRLRKLRLAADEVLTTGCKIAGVCDVLGYPNPTGAGS